jgi:hypothetical protein
LNPRGRSNDRLRSFDDFDWRRGFHCARKRPAERVIRAIFDRYVAKVG